MDRWRPIQTQAQGLLGFLQLKNAGRNPEFLPDEITSVLELREWFWETNRTNQTVPFSATFIPAATGTGSFDVLTVPPGEYWAVLDVDCAANTGAGQALTARIEYREPGTRTYGLSDYIVKAANDIRRFSMARSSRIPILPPTTVVGLHIAAITTAAADIGGNFGCRVAVLRA